MGTLISSIPPFHIIYLYILEYIHMLWGMLTYIFILLTSSTAQGGGGSFKNKKPIGDIGCCESGMAERIH